MKIVTDSSFWAKLLFILLYIIFTSQNIIETNKETNIEIYIFEVCCNFRKYFWRKKYNATKYTQDMLYLKNNENVNISREYNKPIL